VAPLEVFGSAARGLDFDPKRSDFDFLVEFEQRSDLPPSSSFSDSPRLWDRCSVGRSIS
jgi:predicted nucleotidyltransferase